ICHAEPRLVEWGDLQGRKGRISKHFCRIGERCEEHPFFKRTRARSSCCEAEKTPRLETPICPREAARAAMRDRAGTSGKPWCPLLMPCARGRKLWPKNRHMLHGSVL